MISSCFVRQDEMDLKYW